MNHINNLLNQITIINNKNEEILKATGGRFNIFQICGVNHYENTHSAIIAEFLNPNGTHGLKSKFLNNFIKSLGEKISIINFNCEKANVYTEYYTKEGRIDILIKDNQNKVIIIENKIYATDQPEQLKRYDRFANKYKFEYQIVYLTLLGNNASEQSGEGVYYLPISYKEHIINWLENCAKIAYNQPIVRETIIQYINHLKKLTHQDMNENNRIEVTEVLSKVENLRAAKAIHENYSEVFNYLTEKYFNPKMIEFAKQNGLDYHYEKSEELHINFFLVNTEWKEKYKIGFYFEGNCYHYGLYNDLKVYKISDINILQKRLEEKGISSINRILSDWWPIKIPCESLSLDIWENDIIKSDNFVNDCKQKMEILLEAMEGIEL